MTKQVTIRPNMPAGWENASLKNLPVGDNYISISMTGNTWQIDQTAEGWTLVLELPEGDGYNRIELKEWENTIVF